jgi:hypothetical protein
LFLKKGSRVEGLGFGAKKQAMKKGCRRQEKKIDKKTDSSAFVFKVLIPC